MGDNREKNNKNYDKAYTELKLTQKRCSFFATNLALNQVHENQWIG
jgi:hypothetical protein